SSFVASNRLNVQNSEIKNFIIGIDNHPNELEPFTQFYKFILSNYEQLDIEDLIELFEFVISPVEKEVNGAIYTPLY
ncbi:MAG: SAM-dependent DNA methyltransferase, partial [Firmicutes bacterium]|nr:SAM-dependent DNA methyltransferase [Bacillota bacterium]